MVIVIKLCLLIDPGDVLAFPCDITAVMTDL